MIYKNMSRGSTYTATVDGREQLVTRPGMDLSTITGLPVPEGFDAGKVLSDTGKKYDKNQIDGARFGE